MSKGYLYDNGDELISREDALPDTSEASSGDVLSLDSSKKPVWSAPSGGGGGSVPSYKCKLGLTEDVPENYFIYFSDFNDEPVSVADLYENAIESDGMKFLYLLNGIDQVCCIGIEKESDVYTLYGHFSDGISDGDNYLFAIVNLPLVTCSGSDTEVNMQTSNVFITTLTSPR